MPVSAAPDGIGTRPSLRRIAGLALPALVVLAAEPIYLLVDTAVVGHLGRTPLAALAVGGALMSVAAWLGSVIAYGTTGRAARRYGAGQRDAAVAEGVQASWLAVGVGLAMLLGALLLAGPLVRAIGGDNPEVTAAATGWLRIAALGLPGLMLTTAGNGWLRGVQDTRRPLRYVLVANLVSVVLCPLLVYPAGFGLAGSAIANATAQTLGGLLFVRALVVERVSLRPSPATIGRQLVLGRDLLLRGLAMQACFLSAAAVVARFGTAALGAHQIALQLWLFCALALDSIAIAAQSLIGAALGGSRVDEARWLARRITGIGLVAGVAFAGFAALALLALPTWFGADRQVYAQALLAWPWFVAMQPLAGVVFALDGVLIGAGDVAYLRNLTLVAALSAFLPAVWLALVLDAGLGGVWAGLTLFIVVRLVALLLRLRNGRWAVVGAAR